ncbi:MAG TPA: DUF1492 domain-containing protein, partial [Chloroflexota bacterium]|nr:DUF1492 domain-containing protein [Chloroflexota bacterium]
LMQAWGYERVPGAKNWNWGPHQAVEGFVLDLRSIGVERWIESILSGEPMPRTFKPVDVESELQRLLPRWWDDELLTSSPLLRLPAVSPAARGTDRAGALRRAVQEAVEAGAAIASPEMAESYRALDMAYMHRAGTHEQVAEQLCVSRATFYRLLKRAIRATSELLTRAPADPQTRRAS